MGLIDEIDARIAPGSFPPRWGWHDDHRERDKTPEYLPALMQVRSEYAALLDVIARAGLVGGRCLQLGMGECDASHEAWRVVFSRVATIDLGALADQGVRTAPGANTHSNAAVGWAAARGPFDFLFVDAGHSFDDVRLDHRDYGSMVRPGGIVAFHDSLRRDGYEEVEVWRYLESLGPRVNHIGSEVGIAWIAKE